MYQIGDLIVYEGTGVCKVADIARRHCSQVDEERTYYVLKPLYQNCTIFIPVHTTKVFMRPIISRDEADRLIGEIPDIRVKAYHNRDLNQLAQHYKASLTTYDCSDLIELTMSIYAKKRHAEEQRRKLGAVDERFMRRAEELLFGELAAALDIPKEGVPDYITERIGEEGELN